MKKNNFATFAIAMVAFSLATSTDAQETTPAVVGRDPAAVQEYSSSSSDVSERLTDAVKQAATESSNACQAAQAAKVEAGMARNASENAKEAAKESLTASESAKNCAEAAQAAAEKAAESAKDAKSAVETNLAGLSGKLDDVGRKLDVWPVSGPVGNGGRANLASGLPAWIAAGVGSLAVVVAFFVLFSMRRGIGRLGSTIGDSRQQSSAEIAAIGKEVKAVRAVLGESPLKEALQPQFKALADALRSLDGKVAGFDRTVRDIPGQFDAVAKTISRDAESHRSSILSWLFGRGKTQAPDAGFAQQIENRIEQFQSAVLAAVETDRKLQARKLELDERERRLNERARSLDAECTRARAEGAAAAERRATSLEAANKALAESMSTKSAEFGKQVAALEIERNGAKVAAQQAETACAAAKRQADEAVKVREKLVADVSRLSSEIAKRDQAREAELAKARDEIRIKLEQANADELAGLRAEAKSAREERDKATKTAETIRGEKTAVDAALAAAKTSLAAEKTARESDRESASRELAAEKAARSADRENAEKRFAVVSAERDAAKSRVFPEEFRSDPSFEPLLARLDEWDAHGAPGAALARASLAIFADRKNLPAKIWQRALGDLSLGLAAAMDADKMQPTEIVASLGAWKSAVEKRAAGGPSFSLNLPSVGAKVDISWMHSKSGAATVRRVLSWAVYGQSGNAYMAEVE